MSDDSGQAVQSSLTLEYRVQHGIGTSLAADSIEQRCVGRLEWSVIANGTEHRRL